MYEKASAFHDNIGAGMSLYPNGLRVIRDINPILLEKVRDSGCSYSFRKSERHDGTEYAVADEKASMGHIDEDLHSMGISRWRLHKILYETCLDEGISIHFSKKVNDVKELGEAGVKILFQDGQDVVADILFAADGLSSVVRKIFTKGDLKYTGTTCIMGTSTMPYRAEGISIVTSTTTKCHGASFPTHRGENEHFFQFHIPCAEVSEASSRNWGTLTQDEGQKEIKLLETKLQEDNWDCKYVDLLKNVKQCVKIGILSLEKDLDRLVFTKDCRVILCGDAKGHPPLPYLGQGAQLGLEDAGQLAHLIKSFCMVELKPKLERIISFGSKKSASTHNQYFSMDNFTECMRLYEKMRLPRTENIVRSDRNLEKRSQRMADESCFLSLLLLLRLFLFVFPFSLSGVALLFVGFLEVEASVAFLVFFFDSKLEAANEDDQDYEEDDESTLFCYHQLHSSYLHWNQS